MKKIMFNDKYGLTEAVLKGRKTMTRRLALETGVPLMYYAWDVHTNQLLICSGEKIVARSLYACGEVVAVAQNYHDLSWNKRFYEELRDRCKSSPEFELAGWYNKMFVKASDMPHHIKITDIKVERLHDISDSDCISEGVRVDLEGVQYSFPSTIGYCGNYPFSRPIDAFAALIDKVSGKGTWNKNPLVWVYEFELCY